MLKKEIKAFTTWLGDNDVCYTVVKPNAVVEITDAIENSAVVNEIFDGKIYIQFL